MRFLLLLRYHLPQNKCHSESDPYTSCTPPDDVADRTLHRWCYFYTWKTHSHIDLWRGTNHKTHRWNNLYTTDAVNSCWWSTDVKIHDQLSWNNKHIVIYIYDLNVVIRFIKVYRTNNVKSFAYKPFSEIHFYD